MAAADQPAAAEADRRLVADDAGGRADQGKRRHDERWATGRRLGSAGARRRRRRGTPRPSRAARSSRACGRSRPARRPWPSGCAAPDGNRTARAAGPAGRARRLASGHDERDGEPGDGGARAGGDQEGGLPADMPAIRSPQQEGERAGDADAGGMAGDGARHHPGVDLVGQQLQAGHVGAGPAQAGEGAQSPSPTRSRRRTGRTADGPATEQPTPNR